MNFKNSMKESGGFNLSTYNTLEKRLIDKNRITSKGLSPLNNSLLAARETANCTPINSALNSIVTRGQQSSRQLMFDCDGRHELTRRSAEKKTDPILVQNNQSITIDDLEELALDYSMLNMRKAADRAFSTPKETAVLLDVSPTNMRAEVHMRQHLRKSVEGTGGINMT
jgi:hypothetical protein